MKKIVAFIFLISSFAHAQFSVNGTITNNLETDWVILYRIEGTKQQFVKNTTIKKEVVEINGTKHTIGTFQFQLPTNTKAGSYRINYRTNGAGYVDFIFNKENVSFAFHPDYPEQTVLFSESNENIVYKNYLNEVSREQQKLDSLQITAIRNPQLDLKSDYKTTLTKINNIQQGYLEITKEMYVQPFIKASLRSNPSEIKTNGKEYMSTMTTTFFDNMDFSNTALINSSFLIDRITDFVFYINYSDNIKTQQKLFKQSIETVFSKIKNDAFKKNIIEFLINQFEELKNVEIIDYLFENQYNNLPKSFQNEVYKKEKLALLATAIGRIAPDFSWKENGKNFKLSTLKEAKNYVLVFWGTGCSHCLNEIPKLHKLLKNKKGTKVIAFAIERNAADWTSMKNSLPNWHHVLGLNKWENKVAQLYNINATPTYFVLDANKKIIAEPEEAKDVAAFLKQL